MPSFLEQQKWCRNIGVGMRPAAPELRAVLSVKMWVWDTHLKPWSTQDESLSQLFSVSCPVISASSTWRAAGMCCFCEGTAFNSFCSSAKFLSFIRAYRILEMLALNGTSCFHMSVAAVNAGRDVLWKRCFCTVFFHVRKYSAFSICFLFQPSF